MDRTRLKHILTHLHDVITNDVPGLQFRIHFYGSHRQGRERLDSDLNLAMEFLSPLEDGEALAYWSRPLLHRACPVHSRFSKAKVV